MSSHAEVHRILLKKALSYPGAWEDHPWGETVVKVAKKVFVFLGKGDGQLGLSLKLDKTGEAALATFGFTEPTGYGLGKAGWVSATFEKGQDVPVPLLLEWLDESYRAVAPAKLVKQLDGAPAAGAKKGAGRSPPKKKAARKRKV